MKIEIKNRYTGSIIFSIEAENIALAVEAAIEAKTDLGSADLGYADLRSADLRYANLGSADLRYANLRSANLRSANLRYADLGYANLRYADLGYADLGSADLGYANLGYANLGSADLRSADLRSADLRYANLGYANLGYANLRSADLRYANLGSADLGYADLGSADLRYANLRSANLRSAVGINKYLCTPLLMFFDQPGPIRAYKLVNIDSQGPYNGGITYIVGQNYNVLDANTDDTTHCGKGINLATLDWCMKEWQPGYRILIAEFTAQDIAVIPIATDGKFRVHRCRIVGEKDLKEIGLIKEDINEATIPHNPQTDTPETAN